LAEEQYLYLTTRGRKTGQPREIEIWFTQSDGRFYVIAEYSTSNWVQNIRAHPAISVRVAGSSFSAQARLVDAAQEPQLCARIQQLSCAKYGWGEGQIVELVSEKSLE
jgi:deazaflavin-dependent oxidoreductase (nitroreductase family)